MTYASALFRLHRVIGFLATLQLVMVFFCQNSHAQHFPYFARHPSGQDNRFVFEFNDHIWLQEQGVSARRVTKHDVTEADPALSPDSTRVAYVGIRGITTEIFVANLATGESFQLTSDGGFDSKIVSWLNNTQLLYSTAIKSKKRGPLLFVLDVNSHKSRVVPLAEASEGCVFNDSFIFVKNEKLLDNNRMYRGGYAQSIYKVPARVLSEAPSSEPDRSIHAIPLTSSYPGISREPVCGKDRVYFLSDRSGRFNIWSMDQNGGDLAQHTQESRFDIGSISMSPKGQILYQQTGNVYSWSMKTGKSRKLEIDIPKGAINKVELLGFDASEATELQVSDGAELALFVIRGNLWAVDTASGRATCLECDPSVRIKSLHLLKKEVAIALWDIDGEYGIFRFNTQSGQRTKIPTDIVEPIEDITVSPDGSNIVVTTISGQLYVQSTETGKAKKLQVKSKTVPRWLTWSTDGKSLAFVTYTPQDIGRITLANIACDFTVDVTSGVYESYFPIFSEDGNKIYFISETNFRSTVTDPWAPRNYWPDYQSRGLIYSIDLQSLQNVSQKGVAAKDSEKGAEKCAETRSKDAVSLRRTQLATRELPVVAANYAMLFWAHDQPFALMKRSGRDEKGKLVDFPSVVDGHRQAARLVFDDDLFKIELSPDRKSLVAIGRGGPFVATIPDDGSMPKKVSLSAAHSLMVPVDGFAEYSQMFREVWRYYRDYFWDPKMNGVNWDAARLKYAGLISKISTRAEFNDVVSSMISELGAGHTSIRSPINAASDEEETGKLGASFSEVRGGLRVTDILDGDLDVMEERSPLSLAKPQVEVGDVITKIDGKEVVSEYELDELLAGMAGKQVNVEFIKPDGRAVESNISVISSTAEGFLRYRHWTYTNKSIVSKRSEGKIGYLHLNASYERDMATLVREYPSIQDKEGIIVDLRSNNGGNIDSWILNFLQRRTWMYLNGRYDSLLYKNPRDSFDGKLVALIDGDTYSNGELIAEGIRRLKLGVLIGTRTSGAGIWVNSGRTLVDGGPVRVPENGSYVKDHNAVRWLIEGDGVKPDIHVDNDPYLFFHGTDSQLEAAVNYIQRERNLHP